MPDVSFVRFVAKHPQYRDENRREYLCSVYCESATLTMVEQHGFYVDETKPSEIARLFAIGDPKIIYCGDEDLVNHFLKWFPEHKDKVIQHGWYSSSIFVVVHIDRISMKKPS